MLNYSQKQKFLEQIKGVNDVDPQIIGTLFGLRVIAEAAKNALPIEVGSFKDLEILLGSKIDLNKLANVWGELPLPDDKTIKKIWAVWANDSLLDDSFYFDIFSITTLFLRQGNKKVAWLPEGVLFLIQEFLPKDDKELLLAGEGLIPLLDFAYRKGITAKTIGQLLSIENVLGSVLISNYENYSSDFLSIDDIAQWSTIVCVPPFGYKYKDNLETYELADRGQGKRSTRVEAEILWVEKSYHLLAENGSLFITVSDGFLSNASNNYAREWVSDHFKINTIISLPMSTFRPNTSIKTSLLWLQKMTPPPGEYQIFMAELDDLDIEDPLEVVTAFRTTQREARP